MFEFLAQQKSQREIEIYWGLRNPSACYELNETQQIVASLANGHFHAVVETADKNWQGRQGMVHQVVMQDITNLVDYDIYLAGGFAMVSAVREDFIAQGADIKHMYADAFSYI
jgi:aquacobalamin reductase/NAD(P)H-flavin reductase